MRQAIVVLLLAASPAFAYSPVRLKRHDVFSRHGAFVLDVNPGTGVHSIYDVRDRTRPLWSFAKPGSFGAFLLSDDGAVVATVGWEYLREEVVDDAVGVVFWNKDGEFRAHLLRDLCPDPPRTEFVGDGPDGWLKWYQELQDHGDSFTLRTTCGLECRFRYADGALLSRQRFALSPRSKVAAGVLILGCAAAVLWYRRRHLTALAADRQRLITQAADWPPAPEQREAIQATRPVSQSGICQPEPGLPRLDEGRQGRLTARCWVLKPDTGVIAGLLLGGFLGGLLGLLVGNGWDMLEWGIWGCWVGGFACALHFLAWRAPS